jgi:two-component system response regulator FixJ
MLAEPIVFVVDDDTAMRESLSWLIQSVGLTVEAYPNAEEFLRSYDAERSGCLVLDVRMPGMGGLALQGELASRGIALPVIIITGYAEVPMAVRALKAGALDFIEKPFSDELLLDRVRHAIEIDRRERLLRADREDAAGRIARLTPRERQVMDLVVAGRSNKVIAITLGLSMKTVEVHRAQVMKRLRVESLAELIQLVMLARTYLPQA